MKRLVVFCVIITLVLCFTGCSDGKTKYTDYSFECFDTVTTIIGYESSKEEFDAVCDEIKSVLMKYHQLYDIYNEYENMNNLYSLNTSEQKLNVDSEIIDLLEFSKKMHNLTAGKVNVAMGSVLSLWHKYREEGVSIPPENLLIEANKYTDINDIIINENDGTVFLKESMMSVDVGAVAKGYALEKVAVYLEEKGVSGYLINVGGNVRAIGNKGDTTAWNVGIENPDTQSPNQYIAQVTITDKAVATSGNYQRYYTVDGKNYHHIIDQSTLMPGELFTSVSVICDDAGVADALSTALFLMPYEEGLIIAEKLGLDGVIWVLPDGNIRKCGSVFK